MEAIEIADVDFAVLRTKGSIIPTTSELLRSGINEEIA
jgi:hypothetical protein